MKSAMAFRRVFKRLFTALAILTTLGLWPLPDVAATKPRKVHLNICAPEWLLVKAVSDRSDVMEEPVLDLSRLALSPSAMSPASGTSSAMRCSDVTDLKAPARRSFWGETYSETDRSEEPQEQELFQKSISHGVASLGPRVLKGESGEKTPSLGCSVTRPLSAHLLFHWSLDEYAPSSGLTEGMTPPLPR
jgi:hypothetical protein